MEKPDWLWERNPLGRVPVLELPEGKTLYESLIVSDYLDETFSESRNLHSLDPLEKAMDRLWIEKFNQVIGLMDYYHHESKYFFGKMFFLEYIFPVFF